MAPSEQRARRLGTSPSPLGCRTQHRGTALMQTQARDARKEAALCVHSPGPGAPVTFQTGLRAP